MIPGNEIITAFLKNVFSERPAKSPDLYFTSALMDIRRAMAVSSHIIREEALSRNSPLPAALKSEFALPPWEADLLTHIFISRPVILVQGGSGCGKTSALTFLRDYCRRLHKNKTTAFGYPHSLLIVDLQDQPDKLKQKRESEEQRDKQSVDFLAGLARSLDGLLKKTLTAGQFSRLFTEAFLTEDETDEFQDTGTRSSDVRSQVRSIYRELQMTEPPSWKTVDPVFEKLTSDHDGVVARYFLFQKLSNIQWSEHGRRLVLVIDNIDPFPEYLQTELIRTLETIAHGATSTKSASEEYFSVVMFARLSTSTRHSGTLDGVSAHRVNFKAPDPAEIVFLKLSMFLLDPSSVAGWQSISMDDRRELSARAWFLWERLANPKEQFTQVLSGLAGTNSRTGCKLAIWWLTSPRLPFRMAAKEAVDDPFMFSRPLGVALLLRLASAVARGFRTSDLANNGDDDGDAWVKTVVELFFENLLGIMISSKVVRKAGSAVDYGSDARARLSQKAREHLMDLLTQPEWRRSRDFACNPLSEVLFEISERDFDQSIGRARLSDRLSRSLRGRERELTSKLKAIESSDVPLAQSICIWLCNGASLGVAATNLQALEAAPGDMLPERSRPQNRHHNPNRWEAVSVLVSPDLHRGRTSRSAINLFSADGSSVSPVALHVLCYLEESEQGLQGVVIRERLRRWGFADDQIARALLDMVHVDRRLIYSEVKDFTYGLADWFDTYHEVRITSAGTGYLNKVVATPAYLQWALLEPKDLFERLGGSVERRLESGIGRLGVVLEGLKHIQSDELIRAKGLAGGSFDVQKSLSPLSWVFFGSLRRFLRDISNYKGSREDNAKERELALQFLEFGRNLRDRNLEAFHVFPVDWDHELINADRDFKERFGLLSEPM